jgi:hypothetical protein
LKTGLYLIKIISKEKTYTSFFNKIWKWLEILFWA